MTDAFEQSAGAGNRRRPTVGVLASWQLYAGTIHTLLYPILRGIYAAARANDCNLLIACGAVSTFAPETRPAWPILSPDVDFIPVGVWNTDGLLVIAPNQGDEAIWHYVDEAMATHPVVFVESAENRPDVSPDNENGILQAIYHLKRHGHRQLAFIGGGPGWQGDSRERLQAFLAGCDRYDLETDQRLMAHGGFSTPGGYQAMRQILATGLPFTGVVAANDESAVGAIQALRAAGLRVPEDVAVTGFDNRFEARNQSPSLTTIDQPGFEIGYQALKLMLRRLNGEASDSTMVRVPARLVIRESCGCSRDSIIANALEDVARNEALRIPATLKLRLTQTMSESVFAGVGQLSLETIQGHCERITNAFVESLQARQDASFQAALTAVLKPVSLLDEDAHAWQNAITTLRYWWTALVPPAEVDERRDEVNAWLDQARVVIGECAQSQLLRYFARQDTLTQQLSLMSADLAESLDIAQIQKTLNQYLPVLDIRHAQLVLFEPEGENPVAWSVFPETAGEDASGGHRFPTQAFPQPSRYPEDQAFHLALLPLNIHQKPAGYVAFDAANLIPCLAVVRQLVSALERIRLYREAAEGRRLAEEADRMKSRFLSTVSHELRTPLNLIVGLSEMQLEQSTADVHRSVERIHTSAQHLGRLIRDVLDLASSDAGQLRLSCEPLDVAEMLQLVLETGRQLARDKGLEWRAEIPPDLPRIWGDRTRLQQVVLNLVSNAVKFTSHGEVRLTVSAEDDRVTLAVRDTGLGIPVDEQPWIFNEFRQSERTTARGYGGLGLGLAICKRLVELHNGEIGVQSIGAENAGSTFYIRLPVLSNVDALPAASEPPARDVVLILTNDFDSSRPIQERLRSAGFSVEVQAVVETSDWFSQLLANPPGAVVMDNHIASRYGWELLRILKGNPTTEEIPVLFYALKQDGNAGSTLVLDYLSKPSGSADLLKLLARQGWIPAKGGQSRTVLIVDDEPGFLEMYAEMIQGQFPGHEVLKARNGREALDVLRREHVDLMLLDLMMPEVDGFGVLTQMREWETARDTAVVVLTSKSLTEDDMARLSRGVSTVLSKGLYDVQEMLAHIETALARNRKLGTESQHLVRKAMAFIHEHYAEDLTRERLAQHVNVSEGHLARSFRQETGITPMAYLNRYRVNQAKSLLLSSDQSITSVAMAVGFPDNNYFSRVFRQEVGCSPLVYRREHRV